MIYVKGTLDILNELSSGKMHLAPTSRPFNEIAIVSWEVY